MIPFCFRAWGEHNSEWWGVEGSWSTRQWHIFSGTFLLQ